MSLAGPSHSFCLVTSLAVVTVGAVVARLGSGEVALSPDEGFFSECWRSEEERALEQRRCCEGSGDATCFDETYTQTECCARGRAMLIPGARVAPSREGDAAEQGLFESEHSLASVLEVGSVFGNQVNLRCFKRSQKTCRALLKQADQDEFWLRDSKELAAQGAMIVYVGASFGALVIALALHFRNLRIVAVEPEPNFFRYLVWNIRENGVADRVVVHNAAVGGAPEHDSLQQRTLRLCVHYGRASRTAACALTDEPHMQQEEAAHVQHVPIMSLASLLPHESVVDLLLMDCEGCEAEALAPGPVWRSLRSRVHRVAGELHYHVFPQTHVVDRKGPDTALLPLGLDVAVALESAEKPTVPTRAGRRLWSSIFGEHLTDPVAGGAYPAKHDSSLRVFVYDLPPAFHAHLLEEMRQTNGQRGQTSRSNCDFGGSPCTETSWSEFYSIVRQLAAEVVVLQKLLRSPLLVQDVRDADLIVVPYLHGLDCRLSTWRNEGWLPRCQHSDLPHALWPQLHHYAHATAARHLFLTSTEPHNMHLSIASQPLLLSVGPRLGDGPVGAHIVVPHLVTDPALQPEQWAAAMSIGQVGERPIEFLFRGNPSSIWRKLIVEQLEAHRAVVGEAKVALGIYRRATSSAAVVLAGTSQSTASEKRRTRFCACPPGDATFTTIRFYDSLLSGCIPVVIAFPGIGGRVSWFRHGGPPVEWTLAFPGEIRWHEAVLEVPVEELRAGRLVAFVRSLPQEKIDRITSYIGSIRSLLVFSWRGEGPDAFSALMRSVSAALQDASVPGAQCCTCRWLPGKYMPRAFWRWWSHSFGQLYCSLRGEGHSPWLGTFTPEAKALEEVEDKAVVELRQILSLRTAVQIVVSSHQNPPSIMDKRSSLYAVLRRIVEATKSNLRTSLNSSGSTTVFVLDKRAKGTMSRTLGGTNLHTVPVSQLVFASGHSLVASVFRDFEHAEANDKGCEAIHQIVSDTSTTHADPSPFAAFWMHLLSAIWFGDWAESMYVFIDGSYVASHRSIVAGHVKHCMSWLRSGGADGSPLRGSCIGMMPRSVERQGEEALKRAPDSCSTVWQFASLNCPFDPGIYKAAVAFVVLAPPLLRMLPIAEVRALAMLATSRKAPYEAMSDLELGDLLLWLAHFPQAYGSSETRQSPPASRATWVL